MRKLKSVFASMIAVVLIAVISALPFGISAFLDRSTLYKSQLTNIDPIQLNLNADPIGVTAIQKLALIGHGFIAELSGGQGIHTPDQIQQYIADNLQRYIDAGLIIGTGSSLEMHTCFPMLYCDANNAELYNLFWDVEMLAASPGQTLHLLVDDHTGAIYLLDYYCEAASAAENVPVSQAKAEQFASRFFASLFDSLNIDYRVEDCYLLDDTTWCLTAACSEGNQSVTAKLYFFGNGFKCSVNT